MSIERGDELAAEAQAAGGRMPCGDARRACLDSAEQFVGHRHRIRPLAPAVAMVGEDALEPAEQGLGADPLGPLQALEPCSVRELEVAQDLVCDRETR